MPNEVHRSEDANEQSNKDLSIISMLLVVAATTAMLIAPSIPNSSVAISAFAAFVMATIFSKMETLRNLFFEALDRSTTIRFSDREPYGDAWDLL